MVLLSLAIVELDGRRGSPGEPGRRRSAFQTTAWLQGQVKRKVPLRTRHGRNIAILPSNWSTGWIIAP